MQKNIGQCLPTWRQLQILGQKQRKRNDQKAQRKI